MEAVREAVPEDGPRLGELVAELVAAIAPQRGGSQLIDPERGWTAAGLAESLTRLLDDDRHVVLVGTLDGVVTGVAVCHHDGRAGHGRRGTLDACYVEPEARGQGLGGLLLDGAMAWFTGHGCHGVDGVALPGDRAAKNFYEGAGFKARLLTMHRRLA
jgi:GNAT superfamily N-acetyltransferase